jgi:hypothetical protein
MQNNGAIDLVTTGAAALSFNGASAGTFRNSSEDIRGLSPDNYKVTVTAIKLTLLPL